MDIHITIDNDPYDADIVLPDQEHKYDDIDDEIQSAAPASSSLQDKELKLLASKGHNLTFGKGVLELLVAEGVEPRLGARRMRTTVESHCRHAVREAMLQGTSTSGELTVVNGKLVIQST